MGKNLQNISDLWLFSKEGSVIFNHGKDTSNAVPDALLTGFFNGLKQFLTELGNGDFYNLTMDGSLVSGMTVSLADSKNVYLVVRFNSVASKSTKKATKFMRKLQKQLETIASTELKSSKFLS